MKNNTFSVAIVGSYPISKECIQGGVESSVYGLANALCKIGEVDVFDIPRLNGKDAGVHENSLTIHRYYNPGKYNQDAILRANEVIRDIIAIHPNFVHIHGTGEYSAYVYQSIKEYGIKVLLTVHGLLHVEKWNLLKKQPSLKHLYQYMHQSRIEFNLLNYADHVIVDTEYVANQIKTYQQKRRIKKVPWMYVIPQGINEDYLQIQPSDTHNVILSVGSISPRKGHLILLKAFDKLCVNNKVAKLIIAGTLSDKDYYTQLKNYIANSPNRNQISLLTNLPQDQLMKLYSQATIYALHSQEESQGIALVEAMAAHLPIVATNVGGIPYVVKDGECGLLSPYGDVETFTANLEDLLQNEQKRKSMAETAYCEAKKYTWMNIAETICNILGRL